MCVYHLDESSDSSIDRISNGEAFSFATPNAFLPRTALPGSAILSIGVNQRARLLPSHLLPPDYAVSAEGSSAGR